MEPMPRNDNNDGTYRFIHLPILLLILLPGLLLSIEAAEVTGDSAHDQPLNEKELQSLQSILAELKTLAPELRILLRTQRQQVGFDPREIHNIERGMSQSQKNLERLIAMHRRNAYNKMRAHFMADDLRRKSLGLKASLGYVKRHILKVDGGSGRRQADAVLKENDTLLVELLERYSDQVNQGVTLLQAKGM
jgi:hypothetical protein